jgi:metal-responsive CopG/Arc/MetJ family transcriptional regulator
METKRIDIRVPVALLEEIEKYQESQKISTRTGALLELVRIGLNQQKKE